MDAWSQYCWIVVVGGLGTFLVGFGIGCNDWGNNFSASVAARALTYRQGLLLGAICEFLGVVMLGPHTGASILYNIEEWQAFTARPELLMYGLMWTALVVAAWLLLCSRLSLPISTNQCVVICMASMGLVLNRDSINLLTKTSTFPYTAGVMTVCLSLVVSPLLGALFAALFQLAVRSYILRSSNSFHKALWALPSCACLTVLIGILFLLSPASASHTYVKGSLQATISCAAGIVAAVCTAAFIVPWMRHQVVGSLGSSNKGRLNQTLQEQDFWLGELSSEEKDGLLQVGARRTRERVAALFDVDIHAKGKEDPAVAVLHQHAEKFEAVTEDCFKWLQILLSCIMALGHGATNATNATAHFATILHIYQHRELQATVDTPRWMLVLAGLGIVMGGLLYSYNVMTVLGVRIAVLTPARGFALQLSNLFVVVLATKLNLPMSTTYITVCATFAVSALEGRQSANKRLLVNIISAWLVSLVVPGTITALLVAQAVYAPSLITT